METCRRNFSTMAALYRSDGLEYSVIGNAAHYDPDDGGGESLEQARSHMLGLARREGHLASKMREGEKGSGARRLSDKMTGPSDAATLRNSIQRCDTIPLYMEDIAAPSAVQDDLVLFYGNPGGLPTEHRRVTEREMKGGRER